MGEFAFCGGEDHYESAGTASGASDQVSSSPVAVPGAHDKPAGAGRPNVPRVSVLIPTYRDMHLLRMSLPPLLTGAHVEVIVINNDPRQDVRSWARASLDAEILVLDMGYDAGFAAAINAGIHASSGEFVLFGNADLFLVESYTDELLSFLDHHPRAGCAGGKLLRYELDADVKTSAIDSAGLLMGRNRRALVRGEGETDGVRFDDPQELFGLDGAGLCIRRSALESIRIDEEYLDESFFMYKEDWDLAWRLRLAGWECWYVPSAVAFHARTSRGLGERSYLSALASFYRNEASKTPLVRFNSLKNQWLMLLKNEDAYNFVRDAPYIISRELMVLGYNLIFAPRTLASIPTFLRLAPSALRKRRLIQGRRAVSPQELRPWLVDRPRAPSSSGTAGGLGAEPALPSRHPPDPPPGPRA
jgi:GT2 family glycosyltransferase